MAAKPNDSGTLAGKRGSGHDWTGEMTLGRPGRKQGRTDARFTLESRTLRTNRTAPDPSGAVPARLEVRTAVSKGLPLFYGRAVFTAIEGQRHRLRGGHIQ
jgi:hypothetical protein